MTPTEQIIAIVSKACPKTQLDGTVITDPAAYSLGILQPAINRALKAGKTVQQIAAVLSGMVQKGGWVHSTGEFSDTDLLDGLGLLKTPDQRPAPSQSDADANADNGANQDEATNRHGFSDYDGVNHHVEDADYETARATYLAAYLVRHPAVAPVPAPVPVLGTDTTNPTGQTVFGDPGGRNG